jgi:hypothetical protein
LEKAFQKLGQTWFIPLLQMYYILDKLQGQFSEPSTSLYRIPALSLSLSLFLSPSLSYSYSSFPHGGLSADWSLCAYRTKFTERLPAHTLPTMWNNLYDLSIKNESSLKSFKKKLKENILCNLLANVTCSRVNCPSCSV